MYHWFDILVTDLSGFFHTPGKRFIMRPDKFHIDAQEYFSHIMLPSLFWFVKKDHLPAMRLFASVTTSRTKARLFSIIGPPCPSHSRLTTPLYFRSTRITKHFLMFSRFT